MRASRLFLGALRRASPAPPGAPQQRRTLWRARTPWFDDLRGCTGGGLATGLLQATDMATTFVTTALRREARTQRSALGAAIFALFLLGLVAGGAGFTLLAMGRLGWAQTFFVADLVAMLSSVSLGAMAPRPTSSRES